MDAETAWAAAREAWTHLLPPAAAVDAAGPVPARPFVTLTYAQGIDGSIASSRRIQLPLSNARSMAMTHALRGSHDAIMVGVGTVLADDPKLSARIPCECPHQPQPVILDPRLDMPPTAYLLTSPAVAKRPWILCHSDADPARAARLRELGARVLPCGLPSAAAKAPATRLDLAAALACLATAGVRSVMVEGGARIIASFLRAPHLVDRVVVTIAPVYVGGLNVLTGLTGPVHTLADAAANTAEGPADAGGLQVLSGSFFHRLKDVRHDLLDGDIVLSGRL